MLKEEKQSYFGPYEKNDFTKSKRVVGILAGLVSIAGIVTMITFGVLKGTVYNDSTSQAEQTVLMIEARSDKSDANTNPIKSITSIYDETDNGCLLKNVFLDGVDFSSKYSAIEVSETPLTVYDSESTVSHYWYYFKVTFSDHYDLDKQDYAFTITDGSDHSKTVTRGSFEDAFSYAVVDYYGATDENSVTTVMISGRRS